jgi:hypothetical protein
MNWKITKLYFAPVALLAIVIVPGLTGCGGGTTNGDVIAHTQATDPAVYEYQDNVQGGVGLSTAPSGLGTGLGTGSLTNPAATDVLFASFGSSATGTIINGAGGTIATGLPVAGTYPAATPGESGLIFRAQVVNGQTASRNVPPISSVSLSEPGGTNVPLTFEYNQAATVAPTGPFIASQFVAPITLSFATATGVYPVTTTVVDGASDSSTTTFEIVVLASGLSAIATDSGATAPTITSGGSPVVPSYTYGPDADGTSLAVVPPGTYVVTTSSGPTTVTTTAGNLTVF